MDFEACGEAFPLVMTEEFALINEAIFKGAPFSFTGFGLFLRSRFRGDGGSVGRKEGSYHTMREGASNTEANSIFNAVTHAHLRILSRCHGRESI